MDKPLFGKSDLAICKSGIYRITEVIFDQNQIRYKIVLLSYLEDSVNSIDTSIPKESIVQEDDLKKFEYGAPRYEMGHRLSDGYEVYLVIFKHDSHKYRYNLKIQNSALVNLTEDDLSWR